MAAACSPPRRATTTAIASWRTGAPTAIGCLNRRTRSSPPTISAGASAPRDSSSSATRPWMSRSLSPGRHDASDSWSAAAASAPSSRRSSRSAGERASLRLTRSPVASSPNPGCPSAASRPASAPAMSWAARTKAPGSYHGTATRSANPWRRGWYSSLTRSASTSVVTSAAPVWVATTHTRSAWAVRSTGAATAPVAQATPPGPVSTTPATSSWAASQPSRRSRAASARATLRGECSAIPNKVL